MASKESSEGCLWGVLTVLILWPFSYVATSFALMLNWNWFIVENLGAPKLTLGAASLVVWTLSVARNISGPYKADFDGKSAAEKFATLMAIYALANGLSIGIGYLMHQWV